MARIALLTLMALAGTAAVARAQRVEAGLVDSVAGKKGGVRAYRDGQWATLSRLHPLYVGDSVVATGKGARARLRLHGRGVRWVCADSTPAAPCPRSLTVRQPARGGGLGIAIRGLIKQALEPLFGGEPWSRTVSTVGRGDDDIVVPLLGATPVLGAGERTLDVAWIGGVAPFSVHVIKDGSGRIAHATLLHDRSATLGRVLLLPGEYGLRIEDSRGTVRLTRFQVVPKAELPALPRELQSTALSGGAQVLIGSAWLAGQGEGRWAWEAYLRLGGLGADDTALQMRAELAAGRLPPN